MNFLAHCLIAAKASDAHGVDAQALVAGGFLGDFVKGPVPDTLPVPLALGVRLHRRIDAYSNVHPGIRQSCARFPAELRRIAPVLVDVIADHLLATEWARHHETDLKSFTRRTYRQIAASEDALPDNGRRFFHFMRENDLLAGYEHWPVASRSLRSLTRRLRREALDPLMDRVVPELLDGLREDFREYFPDMTTHARDWIEAAAQPLAGKSNQPPAPETGARSSHAHPGPALSPGHTTSG